MMCKKLLMLFFATLVFASCKKDKPTNKSSVDVYKNIKVKLAHTIATDATIFASFADSLKKAELLLSQVFSSDDFKVEMYKRNFHDSAYSKSSSSCFQRLYGGTVAGRSIAGKSVHTNLVANSGIDLTINIKKAINSSTLGSAAACAYKITTYDYWLLATNKQLAIRMTKHFAHEFTHIRGYRHDSNVPAGYKWGSSVDKDPAYGTGEVVGVVLDKWIKEGKLKY